MQVQLAPQRGGMELFWRLHIRSNTKRHPLCWCAFLMFTRTAPVPQDTHYNRCNCSFWVRTPSPAKVVLNIIFHSPKKIPFILSLPRQLYWLSHYFLPSFLPLCPCFLLSQLAHNGRDTHGITLGAKRRSTYLSSPVLFAYLLRISLVFCAIHLNNIKRLRRPADDWASWMGLTDLVLRPDAALVISYT